jgi:hypothetical protein
VADATAKRFLGVSLDELTKSILFISYRDVAYPPEATGKPRRAFVDTAFALDEIAILVCTRSALCQSGTNNHPR